MPLEKKNTTVRTGTTLRIKADRLRTDDGERIRDLRGGCAFAPHVMEQCLLALRAEKSPESRLGVGAGELEFVAQEHAQSRELEVRESRRDWNFDSRELLSICNDIAYRPPEVAPDCRLVLLEVSPRLAHAYWEISELRLAKLRMLYGPVYDKATLVLRFYELEFFGSTSPKNQFDLDMDNNSTSHTNEFWEAGKRYIADIGLRMPDDSFVRLARSNPIQMPREDIAPEGSARFMYVDHESRRRARPPMPDIFTLSDSKSGATLQPVDDPYRDIHAARQVRHVYQRLLAEGPRVLSKRTAITPTAREVLAREHAERQQQRREREEATARKKSARRKAAGRKPAPARESSGPELRIEKLADFQTEAPSAEGRIRNSQPDAGRMSNNRITDMPAPAPVSLTTAQPEEAAPKAQVPTLRAETRELVASDDTALDTVTAATTAAFRGSDAQVEDRELKQLPAQASEKAPAPIVIHDDSPRPLDIIRTEKKIVAAVIEETEMPAQAVEKSEAPFLAGLGIVPAPLPERNWPSRPQGAKKTRQETDKKPFDAVAFGAGLEPLPKNDEAAIVAEVEENTVIADTATVTPASETKLQTLENPLSLRATLRLEGSAAGELELAGRKLPQNSDGSFELECTIENGRLVLPFMLDDKEDGLRHRTDVVLEIREMVEHQPWDVVKVINRDELQG